MVGAAPRNADFDFTMTKFWVNGRRGDSCHAVIDQSGLLGESFHDRTKELRNHYYPLEVKRVSFREASTVSLCKRSATTELLQWRRYYLLLYFRQHVPSFPVQGENPRLRTRRAFRVLTPATPQATDETQRAANPVDQPSFGSLQSFVC